MSSPTSSMSRNGSDDEISPVKPRQSSLEMLELNNQDDDESSSSEGDGADDESTLATEPGNRKAAAAKADRESLARGETRAIRALRIVTLLVLVGTAVLVSVAIYYFTSSSQQSVFTSEFEAHSVRVLESFHNGIARQMASFDALSASITSHAIESGSTFPKVTFPNWEVLANNFQIQAQATYVQYMPLVTDEGREEWEEYAEEAKEYLMWSYLNEDSLRREQDVKYGYAPPTPESKEGGGGQSRDLQSLQVQHAGNYSRSIWGTAGNGLPEEPGTGPYLPMWHVGPTIPVIELLNMNGMDLVFYTGPASVVLSTGQASLGIMSDFDDPNDELSAVVALFNAALQLGPYRHELEKFIGDPITNLAYPVFDRFSSSSQQVAGVLITGLYWRLLFQDILPPSARGITVVLSNSLGQAETFTINGVEAIYEGNGDLHDPKYESMVNSANIIEYLTNSAGPQTRSYTAADLSPAFVTYNISVYPTSESEAQYVNSEPIWYAVAVAGTFLFTTSIFLLYNFIVERRQKLVLDRAVKSSAVVRSLFPANVEKRLYEDMEGQIDSSSHQQANAVEKWSNDGANNQRLSKFLETGVVGPKKGKPIADLFPEATVFFADLAGFTKWSSGREPSDVFGLLETVYSTFDSIASKRGVFKVETIGDCYVAVAGLPEPRPGHALIMAKFASDCMSRLQLVLNDDLVDEYGESTRELMLRVGIHSGPVTAGVLRGDRGRFQLFGDSVNTAARMESTGVPGKIQCSQATADLLLVAGKSDWIMARKGLVEAKGKGEMQTYWIEISQVYQKSKKSGASTPYSSIGSSKRSKS